jgi:hypothetical protein
VQKHARSAALSICLLLQTLCRLVLQSTYSNRPVNVHLWCRTAKSSARRACTEHSAVLVAAFSASSRPPVRAFVKACQHSVPFILTRTYGRHSFRTPAAEVVLTVCTQQHGRCLTRWALPQMRVMTTYYDGSPFLGHQSSLILYTL